jgi:nucleoside-diphosphate-sugar epimerase
VSTLIVGCGYLGRRVGAGLRGRDERVYGTVRSQSRAVDIAGLGIEPVIADVLDLDSLRALPMADHVFYCVGFDRSARAAMHTVYVDGLQNVLDSLPRSVKRFVYASSSGVYGQTDGESVDEHSPTHPQHESGRICLEAEQRIRTWADSRAGMVSAVILRYVGLYGPDRVVRRTTLERAEPIPGDPAKLLNLIHIDDAALAGVAALEAINVESIYLIADDRPVTRHEYYSLMATLLSAPEPRFQPPGPENRDATNKRVTNARMKRSLGFKLIYPDITTGLPAAIGQSRLQP